MIMIMLSRKNELRIRLLGIAGWLCCRLGHSAVQVHVYLSTEFPVYTHTFSLLITVLSYLGYA